MGIRNCLPLLGLRLLNSGQLNRLLIRELFPYRSSGVNFQKAVEGLCVFERHKHVILRSREDVSFQGLFPSRFNRCRPVYI